jgi:hypothetical protein
MQHPPTTQLLQHPGFAPDWHFTGPFSIYAQPERATRGKGEIDQFDPQLFPGFEVGNDDAIVWFGTGHAPFYRSNPFSTSQKSKILVHNKIYAPVYRPPSITS